MPISDCPQPLAPNSAPQLRGLNSAENAICNAPSQQIIEVVRDAASQLPDRLHLLRLAQLGLGLLQLLRAFANQSGKRIVELLQIERRLRPLDRVECELRDLFHERYFAAALGPGRIVEDTEGRLQSVAAKHRRLDRSRLIALL
jgi:hypothetical protein